MVKKLETPISISEVGVLLLGFNRPELLNKRINEVYKSTTASITNQIKSLKDFKTAFNTGASSILTPQEKYNLAKADFQSTAKESAPAFQIGILMRLHRTSYV